MRNIIVPLGPVEVPRHRIAEAVLGGELGDVMVAATVAGSLASRLVELHLSVRLSEEQQDVPVKLCGNRTTGRRSISKANHDTTPPADQTVVVDIAE